MWHILHSHNPTPYSDGVDLPWTLAEFICMLAVGVAIAILLYRKRPPEYRMKMPKLGRKWR